MVRNLLSDALEGLGGTLDVGELALRQTGSDKILPRSLWGRWTA
jgi:23S rRNA (cytosine1962-C5)-methyltransferase